MKDDSEHKYEYQFFKYDFSSIEIDSQASTLALRAHDFIFFEIIFRLRFRRLKNLALHDQFIWGAVMRKLGTNLVVAIFAFVVGVASASALNKITFVEQIGEVFDAQLDAMGNVKSN